MYHLKLKVFEGAVLEHTLVTDSLTRLLVGFFVSLRQCRPCSSLADLMRLSGAGGAGHSLTCLLYDGCFGRGA